MKVKKFIIITLLLTIFSGVAMAQDIIYLRNGEEISAIVQKVGATEIEYKKSTNSTGPSYTVPKSDVFMIKYKNGEKDIFQQTSETPKKEEPEKTNQMSSNSASITKFEFENMDDDDVEKFLRTYNADLYKRFSTGDRLSSTGRRLNTAGAVIGGVGVMVIALGYISLAVDEDYEVIPITSGLGGALAGVGVLCLGAGIPLKIVGNSLKNSAKRGYIEQNFSSNKITPTLDLYAGNGIGFVIHF